MLVYYFVPFIVSNRYLLFWVSNVQNSVTVQNRTRVYMNYLDHKDLGNHHLQLCPKVVKHPVYTRHRRSRVTLWHVCVPRARVRCQHCNNASVLTLLLNWEVKLLTVGLSGIDSSALRPAKVKASFVVFLPLLDNCWDSTWNWTTSTSFLIVSNVTVKLIIFVAIWPTDTIVIEM